MHTTHAYFLMHLSFAGAHSLLTHFASAHSVCMLVSHIVMKHHTFNSQLCIMAVPLRVPTDLAAHQH